MDDLSYYLGNLEIQTINEDKISVEAIITYNLHFRDE